MLGLGMNLSKKRKTGGGGGGASPYQQWSGYPDSRELTVDYPYQYIYDSGGTKYLRMMQSEIYKDESVSATYNTDTYAGGVWVAGGGPWTGSIKVNTVPIECNYDIYTDSTKTVVAYPKTT